MTIIDALKRIKWRFSQKKGFTPNDTDIIAVNVLISFTDEKLKEQFNDNQLFGKLYCYLFVQFVKYYKTTYDDPIPQKELNKLCDMDLDVFFQRLTDSLWSQETNAWLDMESKNLDNIPKLEKTEVEENLKAMANMALLKYNK